MATNTLDKVDSLPNTEIEQVDKNLPTDCLYIFTDIETESFLAFLILQIAAVTSEGHQFNSFINPCRPLSEFCTNFLGFYFFKGRLFRNGRLLPAKPVKQALEEFSHWISNFNRPVVLVYHNGFSFDCSVLAKYLVRFNISIPTNLITVCDSLPYIRTHFKFPEIRDHKLGTLASHFGLVHEHAHDALSDSLVLKQVCEAICKQHSTDFKNIFKESCRPFSDYIDKILYGKPLQPLRKKKKRTPKKKSVMTEKQIEKTSVDKSVDDLIVKLGDKLIS